jgi:lysozyme
MFEFLVATVINYQTPKDLFPSHTNQVNTQPVILPLQQINQKGIQLVKHFEGLYLSPYVCPSGKKTIGFGHTGKKAREGRKITAAQAEALLQQDLAKAEAVVRKFVKVPLNSNQFSVLVSFTFNTGAGAFQRSTLLKLVNQQDFAGAAVELGKWVHGNRGRRLQGLVLRREAERKLFEEPVANEF